MYRSVQRHSIPYTNTSCALECSPQMHRTTRKKKQYFRPSPLRSERPKSVVFWPDISTQHLQPRAASRALNGRTRTATRMLSSPPIESSFRSSHDPCVFVFVVRSIGACTVCARMCTWLDLKIYARTDGLGLNHSLTQHTRFLQCGGQLNATILAIKPCDPCCLPTWCRTCIKLTPGAFSAYRPPSRTQREWPCRPRRTGRTMAPMALKPNECFSEWFSNDTL